MLLVDIVDILCCRYAKENKLPSPSERMEFSKIIKDAEEMVIREGKYQIGK